MSRMKRFREYLRDRRGQGMAEYIIIVVFIAVLSIAVIKLFGANIRELFIGSAKEMVGEDSNIQDKMDGVNSVRDIEDLGGDD